jgi:hypothetical protein
MNSRLMAISVLACIISSSATAEKLIVGDVDNLYIPTDKDFSNINKNLEYLTAKKKLIETQQEIVKLQQVNQIGEVGGVSAGSTYSIGGSSIPRELRGTEAGDTYIDSKGNKVVQQKKSQAFLSSVSGLNGKLKAEVFWGDRILLVKKGDTLIGGNWVVQSVNTDDLVLSNGSKSVRLGVVPVNIDSFIK